MNINGSPPFLDLPQILSARGTVRLPGSKSITNRFLLLAALAEGETELQQVLFADDTARMLEALSALGIDVRRTCDGTVRIRGAGGTFPQRSADLFLGNAGTALRPLTAALALSGGNYRIAGVPRMHERPIADLVDALRQVGADIDYLGVRGFPPLDIFPCKACAQNVVQLRGDVSSQFLTGLLLALPLRRIETRVDIVGKLVSTPYVALTLATMQRFGVVVERDGWQSFTVPAASTYRSPGVVRVEGDASSASYFLALGALGGGPVRVEGVGVDSMQGDVRFADALQEMGAEIRRGPDWLEARAPASGKLRGIALDCVEIPDAAMTLATAALFADGPSTLRGIASWRIKETDRIAAMASELRKLGAGVEAGDDFLRVWPPAASHELRAAAIDTYEDHRMAMCFSLAALATPLRINEPGVVSKTFPDYFQRFAAVTQPAPVLAVDGTSASGKGTVAQRVADTLGWHYLDSGALYRLTALAASRAGVDWEDEHAVAQLAADLAIDFAGSRVLLGGEDVSDAIRSEEMSSGASRVAALPAVRAALLFRQRAFRRAPGLVADGRDMGSVVFPDAMRKVFLAASLEKRAERRYKQLIAKGMTASIEALLLDLRERDERDRDRPVSPVQQSADAESLDTTNLTIETAVAQVLAWVNEAPQKGAGDCRLP